MRNRPPDISAVLRMLISAASVLVVLMASASPALGQAQGRRGNELYHEGAYEEAASAYRQGLDAVKAAASAARFGLLNNLGSALYRLGRFAEARAAFESALEATTSAPERARAAYNAGNTAFRMESFRDAAAFYRAALLLNPSNEDARFNYELASRRLDRQEDSKDEGERIQPSAYSRAVKARADQLVAARQYGRAYALMTEASQQDPTIEAYQDFIQRTRDVASIAGQLP